MEDYKKKYEEALENFKKIKAANKDNKELVNFIEYEYPELKKSEDEKIRKELKSFFDSEMSDYGNVEWRKGIRYGEIVAWLEKQGEQKANEIHPIFRVGDYIKNKKTSDKVLIEQLDIATKAYCYVSYDGGAEIHSDFSFSKQDEWMLIGQNIVEQKPAWSEEDNKLIDSVIELIDSGALDRDEKDYFIEKLESLKNRVLPKQEWSEEDEVMLDEIIDFFENGTVRLQHDLSLYASWLKSLKDRYTWKPSNEQMKQLGWVAEQNKNNIIGKELMSLYQDLKKLKEE